MKQLVHLFCLLAACFGSFSAVGQINVLSPSNAVYRYLDDGSNQGTAWRTASFNDATWPSGTAPIGYGMTSITTTTATGRITYYYRRTFSAAAPSAYSNLTVHLRRDDGGVVYLNGAEVFRSNMPTGAVDSTTLASGSISGGSQFAYFSNNVSPSALLAGANQLAVEIHQASANNVDGAFDLELLGYRIPCTAPALSALTNQTACAGSTATFCVNATGTPPLTYQWYFNGAAVSGATTNCYSRGSLSSSNGGTYCVVVANACGSATNCATLTVSTGPGITSQPTDAIAPIGGSASFTVGAAGTPTLTYQWYFNGAPLGGATSPTLTRNPVQAGHEGSYYVVVANGCGSITSNVPRLRIVRCCTNNLVAGYNLIGCPYENGGNTLNELMGGVPAGSKIYKFDNASQSWQVSTFNGASWVPNLTLLPGEGAFLQTPSAFNLVLCGTRRTPVLPINIPPGKCFLLSRQFDDTGTYDNIVGTPPQDGAALYLWSPASQGYAPFVYDASIGGWDPQDPIIKPCSAVWICPQGSGNIPPPPQPPTITGVSPGTVQPGCLITIAGTGFGNNPDNVCAVVMSGTQIFPLQVVEASDTQLRVRLNGLPPGTPVTGRIAVATGEGQQLGIIDIGWDPPEFASLIDPRPADGVLGYVGTCDADPVLTDIGPTVLAGGALMQPAWVFRTFNAAVLSPGAITLNPPPAPGKGTNWVFARPATNCAVTFILSNDCPALTKVFIQGDLAVTSPNGTGLDIILPNLILKTRLPAAACAQAICQLLTGAYAQAGITIQCTVLNIGTNAAQITITVPGGCVNSAGVMLCFTPAEAGRPDPVITGVDPLSGAPGDIVTITGRGFGNNPDDVCVQIMNGPRTIWMRALTARDDRITAEIGSVPVDAVPGNIGLVRGFGRAQLITDRSNVVVNPIPAWGFASTKPGIRSAETFTPIHPSDPLPPPPGQPIKKKFLSQPVNPDGTMCIFLDPDCDPNTKISIHAHFDLRDTDPNDGLDCPLTHIDTAIDGTWWHSQLFTGSGTGGDCVDFVCQYLTQIFYDEYNAQFGQCYGYPISCSADRATGKITLNAECGCQLISGVVEVEYCIPPAGGMPGPVITSIDPPTFTSGQTIFVTGANFLGGMPDDHCLVLINSNRLIPLRAIAATPTMLTVEVGPIPPDAQPGRIGLALGDGSTGTFRPAFFDIFPEPAWFFANTNGGVSSPQTVTPTYTPPPPQQTWYHSFLSNGQIYVFLPGPCPPGTKLIMDGHFDIRATNSPIRHADCWLPAVAYLQGGSASDCARRICDSFVCGFLQRTGVRLGCQVIPVGNGALVCLGYPGGTIVNGGMTVCTRICDQPPIAQCVTNSVYIYARGTTNDNFVGPEAASPRPELVTYLNSVGVTTLRGYDDASNVVNRMFAESFGNLPVCITKATLRIRLRANKDIEVNDSITLAFAGAGGVLDPDRWSAYIGSGNPGASVLSSQWLSPSVAELVLDLSRLPLGGNMFKDLIPTLCAKGYLDILLQDDTSVDYAVLTLESCRCRPDIIACSQPGLNGAIVSYTKPVFTDQCCPGVSTALNVVCIPASGAVFPVGTSYVRCTATDVEGRRSRCCFGVTVLPYSPPTVCPNATTLTFTAGTTNDNFLGAEPGVVTPGLIRRLNMAGVGCIKGFDNCGVNCFFAHVFTNLPPCITEATLRIRIMACGDISRNDTIGISYTLPSGALAFGGWGRYIGSGNSGPGLLNTPWSPGSVQEFNLDLSTLPTASGGTMDLIPSLAQWGAFEVIVQDDSAVDFVELRVKSCCCRQDIVVNTANNQCCAVVNYPLPQFSDTCGNTNFFVNCSPPPTNCFPVGTNLVECRAGNAAGGPSGRCFFKVIVRDAVAPVILSCPTNVIACTGSSNNVGVMPDLTAQVIATDNCTPASQLVITQFPPPGSNVTGGTPGPTVTFYVTDAAGNSNFCVRPIIIQPCCVSPPSGLALWLPFDELAGPRAINAAGGNNGTLLNGVVRDSSGYVGRELCFDGNDDAVTVASYPAINLGTNDLSIDAWVKRDPQSPNSPPSIIVDKRDPTNGVGYSLSLSFGRLVFQLADSSGFSNFADGVGLVPADNQWHFVAVTVCRYLTNGGRFYVDGVPGTLFNPTTRAGSINNNGSFYVGRSLIPGNRPWLGCIDEVEVFRRCLATSEITSLYNARYLGKCRTRCIVPWDTPICKGQTSVVVTASICNPAPVAQTYSYNWLGLPPGPGCSYPGPNSFSPAAGTITVAANSCTNIPVIIGVPAGMPCGAIACYQLIVVPAGTNKQQFSCEGSLYMSCQICARPPILRTNITVGVITSLGAFTLANSTLMPLDLTGARLSAWDPDMQPDTRAISLNGLPPGVPWEVPPGLILPPSSSPFGPAPKDVGSVSIPLQVQFMDYDPGRTYTILLEADTDGDGQFEPLSSLEIENVIIPEARLIITSNPDHTVTLTWPEDYTLQQNGDLSNPNGWSAAPVQASPLNLNPAGTSKRFYRLLQP